MRRFQIQSIETFRETVIHAGHALTGFDTLAVFPKQACKCHGRPEFKTERMLRPGLRNRRPQTCRSGFTVLSRREDLPLDAQQFGQVKLGACMGRGGNCAIDRE